MATSSSGDRGTVTSAAAGGVNITDKMIFHEGGSMRTAGLVFQIDGTVNWRRTFTFVQYEPLTDWIIPNASASAAYDVRLTNLTWVTMDEGFGVSPSGVVAESDATALTFSGSTITRTGGGSFITAGFTAGGIIRIDRSASNNSNFTIAGGGVTSTVITVDETFVGEGPVNATVHQGGWVNSTTVPTGGDADGDEDTWYDLGTRREWTFVDEQPDAAGTQHATFDLQIRRGSTILTTAACDWYTNHVGGGGGGGGGGGCFMYDTQIRMADNSLKSIQDIEIGDIMKEGGRVKAVQIGDATKETWYDCDGVIATGTHTICKDGVWMGIEDAGYPVADEQPDRFYIVSNQNHKILSEDGQLFTDYQEVDYISSGWDDWVVSYLNGESNVNVLRDAIISTGLESKRARDFLNKEGMYEEDYNDKKERLLGELAKLEEWKRESVLARVKKD